MSARLDEDIREALGKSYSPSASFDLESAPTADAGADPPAHLFAVFDIGSAPDQLDMLSGRLTTASPSWPLDRVTKTSTRRGRCSSSSTG